MRFPNSLNLRLENYNVGTIFLATAGFDEEVKI